MSDANVLLAQYVLDAAKAYEESYDKEASDAAVEAQTVPAYKPPAVTASELMGRSVSVGDVKHTVVKCLKNGEFKTDNQFTGRIEDVVRVGRSFRYEPTRERVLPVETIIDFSKFQKLNIFQATVSVVPVAFQMPVYLLLTNSWNDALDWATRTVNEAAPKNYAFDIEFEPDANANSFTHQVHADNELAAAFMVGQLFPNLYSYEFTIKRNPVTYSFVESKDAK